jgi:hypothetical protein
VDPTPLTTASRTAAEVRSVRKRQRRQRRRERCSEEGVRRCGRDRWPRWARPHVDGASPGVVEGHLGSATTALAGSQCGGAAGATATTPATATVATTTAATVPTPAASAGGVGGRGLPKGAGEDVGRHYWQGWVKVAVAVHLRQRERWLSPTRPQRSD